MKGLSLAVIPILVAAFLLISVVPVFSSPQAAPRPGPQISESAATSVWWVGADSADSSALPNTGVQATIQVFSSSVSGVLNFWVSDDLSNNMWGQVGYILQPSSGSTPWAFWQVWNLTSNTMISTGSSAVTVGYHTFSMYLASGTTWNFAIDGSAFGSYNMKSSISSATYPVYSLSEEQGSSSFAFPATTFSNAMQVLKSGTWSNVATAVSYGSMWGVQGQAQNSGLSSDEIVIGGSLPALTSGTRLWGSSSTTTSSTGTF